MKHKNYTWDIFIRYASENREKIAKPLFDRFEKHKLKVWVDWKGFRGGDNHTEKIRKALNESMFVVAIFSEDSKEKSEIPKEKTYPIMEIGGVIFNPNNEREKIIPVYYNIPADKDIDIDHIANLHKLQINDNDPDFEKHLDEIAEDINTKVQEIKVEIAKKKKKIKWGKVAFMFLSLCILFALCFFFKTEIAQFFKTPQLPDAVVEKNKKSSDKKTDKNNSPPFSKIILQDSISFSKNKVSNYISDKISLIIGDTCYLSIAQSHRNGIASVLVLRNRALTQNELDISNSCKTFAASNSKNDTTIVYYNTDNPQCKEKLRIDKETTIGSIQTGTPVIFLGNSLSFFKIKNVKTNEVGFIAFRLSGHYTLSKTQYNKNEEF